MLQVEINSHREFMIKWIERLRSGDYVQGDGALRKKNYRDKNLPDSFCPIGVGCELMRDAGMLMRYLAPGCHAYEYGKYATLNSSIERSAIGWPASIARWWNEIPDFKLNYVSGALVRMNDGQHLTFAEMADYLESKVLPLIPEKE